MEPSPRQGEVFLPRRQFGTQLSPPAVRWSAELSAEAKTAWFVLAMYAGVADADYPTFAQLQRRFGVGRSRARGVVAQLEELGLIEARACAGSRKRRFVFLWQPFYEKRVLPPKKPPVRSELEHVGSIVRDLA